MAKTVVNLSDQVSTWVTKTNAISDDVGDVAQLVTGDSNVVDAINTVRTLVSGFDDSAEIIAIARSGLSASGDISYDSSAGTFSVDAIDSAQVISLARGALTGQSGIDYDSSAGLITIDTAFAISNLTTVGTLDILDSDGTTLHTLYKAT